MPQGRFITFEGGEGSGKSTQSRLVLEALNAAGIETILTREPGGTDGAESIRDLLVQGDVQKWIPHTELLLHFAARLDHMHHKILPALKSGTWVVCDRFIDSTFAYQAFGHQLGMNYVQQLQKLVIGNFEPDTTFILDIDVEKGLTRSLSRHNTETRYEKMDISFHQRVSEGYRQCAQNAPHRCTLIDADAPIETIKNTIIEHINTKFNLSLVQKR